MSLPRERDDRAFFWIFARAARFESRSSVGRMSSALGRGRKPFQPWAGLSVGRVFGPTLAPSTDRVGERGPLHCRNVGPIWLRPDERCERRVVGLQKPRRDAVFADDPEADRDVGCLAAHDLGLGVRGHEDRGGG